MRPAPRSTGKPRGYSSPGPQTDRRCPPEQASFTNPVHKGRKSGTRYDLNSSAEVEAERVRGPPGFAVTAKAAN